MTLIDMMNTIQALINSGAAVEDTQIEVEDCDELNTYYVYGITVYNNGSIALKISAKE